VGKVFTIVFVLVGVEVFVLLFTHIARAMGPRAAKDHAADGTAANDTADP